MRNFTLGLFFILLSGFSFGQVAISSEMEFAQQKLSERGEFYFTFPCSDPSLLLELTKIISIDNVKNGIVFAFATSAEFEIFLSYNLGFSPVYTYYNTSKALTMATTVAQMASWDRYPTHAVYEEMMQDFVDNYPSLARIETIGTSINGWPILCLVISDNVNTDEDEPEFWWSSSMHGDETTGIILSLRYIDYLLSNYGSIPQVTNLVNNIKIYVNPMSNPDGTFYLSSTGTSISSGRRTNANNVDLNRNFPRMDGGTVNNQNEIQIMMDYATAHDFVMSVNFHGGAEVANYPWDTYTSAQNRHADDTWWNYVSHVYADNVISVSGGASFTDTYANGVTEGGDWYVITGSRQDYMNYFQGIREITLEISSDKNVEVANLNTYWNYNRKAMLDYTEQVLYGFRGIVTDACSGTALSDVKVEIIGHDEENSFVYSSAPVGNYHRPIYAGTWTVTFSKTGYQSQTKSVSVINDNSTRLDIQLIPDGVASPNFTASETNVFVGETVNFTNTTSGTVSSRVWTFEGGTPGSSTLATPPSITYSAAGTYDVILSVVSSGCTVAEAKIDHIVVTIPGAPVAGFTADVTSSCSGLIQFTNSSVDADSYLWDFGDGSSTSSEGNPVHTYTTNGTFTVVLTATNAYGSDDMTKIDYITINLPVSPVTAGAESCSPSDLTLTATGTGTIQWWDSPTNGNLINTGTSYTDNFTSTETYYVQSGVSAGIYNGGNPDVNVNGGNHTSNSYYLIFTAYDDFTLVSVQVNSSTAGNRIIELRNSGGTILQSITANLTVGVNTVSLNFDIAQGTNYQLRCGTTSPNLYRNNSGTAFPYIIPEILSITGTNATDANYYYYYYNWVVSYDGGCVSSRTPVTASILGTPGDVTVTGGGTQCGGSMILSATGGIEGTIYWQNTNPNGVNTTTASSSQTVSASGTYYFRAQSAQGCWGNQGSAVVTINPTVNVSVSTSPESSPGANDGIAIASASNGTPEYSYSWQFPYSGNPIVGLAGGDYCVTVQDINNCTASACGTVSTNGSAPIAEFSADEVSGCDNLTVSFTDLSSSSPTIWAWDFGDGATSTEQNPSHSYPLPGTYTVALIATNLIGSDNETKTDYITVGVSPAIMLSMTASSFGNSDGTATANASGGTEPYEYTWSGPSGFTSDLQSISSLLPGEYCLTLTEQNGCQANDCITVTEILPSSPVAEFTSDSFEGCGNLTVNFMDLSTNNPTSWEWNFGDGSTTSSAINPQHIYTSPGNYTVSLTVSSSFGNDDEAKVDYITVHAIPSLSFNITHESGVGMSDGQIEMIVTGGTEPYTINWSNGMHSLIISDLLGGLYSVGLIDANGCINTDFAEVQTLTSIRDVVGLNIMVYPSPSRGSFTVEASQRISNIQIFNALGQICYNSDPNSTKVLVTESFTPGIYVLKIYVGDDQKSIKMIVE